MSNRRKTIKVPCLQEFDLSRFENESFRICENIWKWSKTSKIKRNQQAKHVMNAEILSPQLRFAPRHPAALGPAPELQVKDRCAVLHAQPPPAVSSDTCLYLSLDLKLSMHPLNSIDLFVFIIIYPSSNTSISCLHYPCTLTHVVGHSVKEVLS